MAHGLSALHADGGVHRNINAGNIYVDEKGRAKLGSYQCLKVPHSRVSAALVDIQIGNGQGRNFLSDRVTEQNLDWISSLVPGIPGLFVPTWKIAQNDIEDGFGCPATVPPEYELHGEVSPKVRNIEKWKLKTDLWESAIQCISPRMHASLESIIARA